MCTGAPVNYDHIARVRVARLGRRTLLESTIGRFRYTAYRAKRGRFVHNCVWAFNLAPAFPRGALTL